MINNGIKNVPEKTIAIFPSQNDDGSFVPMSRINNILQKCEVKRDWFDQHFYRCLPLTIGNSYGFLIKSEYAFEFEWNGGVKPSDISFHFFGDRGKYPEISSHFGHGIITINPPFVLRTPPNVNLLTINPPNHIIRNITAMSGVVEADNLRRNFTFNLKIQVPNLKIRVPAFTPIAGFIPVPRYFADSFNLKNAFEIFDKDYIKEEYSASKKADEIRENATKSNKFGVDRYYYSGKDPFGNVFKDHQKPKKIEGMDD